MRLKGRLMSHKPPLAAFFLLWDGCRWPCPKSQSRQCVRQAKVSLLTSTELNRAGLCCIMFCTYHHTHEHTRAGPSQSIWSELICRLNALESASSEKIDSVRAHTTTTGSCWVRPLRGPTSIWISAGICAAAVQKESTLHPGPGRGAGWCL